MKKFILTAFILSASVLVFAQKKTTTSAVISFDATTAIDNLPKAENKTVVGALDTKTGSVQFEAAIKNFAFSNPRIQEHFNNSTWMDSDQFPKASFSGKITNLKDVNFGKEGSYTAKVEGGLTMHGVTQKIQTDATITVKGGVIHTASSFSVKIADYNINGPAVGAGKVSKEPRISISADF